MGWAWTPNEEALGSEFDRALQFRDEGRIEEALEILLGVLSRLTPADRKLLLHTQLQIGHLYRQRNDHVGREAHFRAATLVAPKSELASLSWFHALWTLGRREDALREAIRFVTSSDSPEYRELFSPDYCDGLPDDERVLALDARARLNSN